MSAKDLAAFRGPPPDKATPGEAKRYQLHCDRMAKPGTFFEVCAAAAAAAAAATVAAAHRATAAAAHRSCPTCPPSSLGAPTWRPGLKRKTGRGVRTQFRLTTFLP